MKANPERRPRKAKIRNKVVSPNRAEEQNHNPTKTETKEQAELKN